MSSREVTMGCWKPITELQTLEHGFRFVDLDGYVWWRRDNGQWVLLEERQPIQGEFLEGQSFDTVVVSEPTTEEMQADQRWIDFWSEWCRLEDERRRLEFGERTILKNITVPEPEIRCDRLPPWDEISGFGEPPEVNPEGKERLRKGWLEYWAWKRLTEHQDKPWYGRLWDWVKWCFEPDPPPWRKK
jgi:hypothetical protein